MIRCELVATYPSYISAGKSSMQINEQKKPVTLTPDLLFRTWQAFFYQSIGFTVILLAGAEFLSFGGYRPEWAMYTMIAGALSLMPSFYYLPRYRDLLGGMRGAQRSDPAYLEQVRRRMTVGMVIGDLPAFAGFVHYVFTADAGLMFIFCAASNIVIFFHKPPR